MPRYVQELSNRTIWQYLVATHLELDELDARRATNRGSAKGQAKRQCLLDYATHLELDACRATNRGAQEPYYGGA
jgi:hypothetical protein